MQSHQQALKSANPITDLEQTISRGMTDPYTDPRFVMNQINEDFFGNALKNNLNAGTPLVENSLHNRELMAFRNLPFSPQGKIGINSLTNDILPGNLIGQHAAKDRNVDVKEPAQAIDEALSRLMKFKNTAKKQLSQGKMISSLDVSKLTRDPRLPSNLKIAHLTSDVIRPSEEKQEDSTSRGLPGNVELDQSAITNEQIDAPTKSTADLDDKANYGSINNGENPNIGDTLSSLISQNGPKASDILPTNPGSITNKEMEENFSSIKAFIDADEDLRQKKVIEPVRNPLEDLLHAKHKKHKVPKARRTLRKIITS